MIKKLCCLVLGAMLLALSFPADAQQPKKVPRMIGFLQGGATPVSLVEAFREGLRELGYVEGQNIVIEYRRAQGKLDQIPALVAELVRLKVDVIFTPNGTAALAAKKATSTIPIVIIIASDPVGIGLVTSLARPGGNVTGVTSIQSELAGKRLELLKQLLPRASRIAILWDAGNHASALTVRETETAAKDRKSTRLNSSHRL